MASPWAKTPTVSACSLADVMSEELVKQMVGEDVVTENADDGAAAMQDLFLDGSDSHVDNDFMLAQMLQYEFDKEFDRHLKAVENQTNAQSSVKVSFKNFRTVHPAIADDEPDSEEEAIEQPPSKGPALQFNKKGISGKGKNIVTKHNAELCGRKNVTRIMDQLPPEISTGDGDELLLPNSVYNQLKVHRQTENKRAQRVTEKKQHSTAEHAVDDTTRLMLYKMITSGVLEDVVGVVSVGKEAVVLYATGRPGAQVAVEGDRSQMIPVPQHVAIKVFKTTLSDFKNRADYMKGDPRFFKDEFKKQNPRKIMRLWAEKEVLNLRRMRRFNIPCPSVIYHKKHIIVMSFIGCEERAAPKLKDVELSTADMEVALDQCKDYMTRLYRECLLVHGDLSEYNMLWQDNCLYLIDVSQAVDRSHPHAHEFLLRDCHNVCTFFTGRGATDCDNPYALFNEVTGLDLKGDGHNFLMQMEDYEKNEDKLRQGTNTKDFPFDYFFELGQQKVDHSSSEEEESELTNIVDNQTEIPLALS